MSPGLRCWPPCSVSIAVAAVIALAIACPAMLADAKRPARARATHTMSGDENASLHLVHASGSTLSEAGQATGSLPGRVRATLRIGATFTGSFTFYTRYGQIRGHGSAHPHGSGRYESFAGTDVITGGTGRYREAHGHGGFFGVFDRNNDAVQIQTRGTLFY